MKLTAAMSGPGAKAAPCPRFAFKEPLLAISIAIPLMFGCNGEGKGAQPQQPDAAYSEQIEIPHFIPPSQAYPALPNAGATPQYAGPAMVPQGIPAGSAPSGTAQPALSGIYPILYGIIASRMAQDSPKMRLSPAEGRLAESYLKADLPSMQSTALLASTLPKTAIELVRAVHERGVTRDDTEGIAAYLNRMLGSMRMSRLGTFDECCSHVLGRRWDQIDYSGEKLDARKQERRYSSQGVPDLLTLEHVRRYFAVESKMPYFKKVFNPQGPLPEF